MLGCAYYQHVYFATFIKAEVNCLGYVISDSQNRISKIVKGSILGHSYQDYLTLEWLFIIKPEKSSVSHRYTVTNLVFNVVKELCEPEVKKKLTEFNDRKTGGPYGINSCFLKNFAFSLSRHLSKSNVKSLEKALLPKIWKKAYVSPLHKSGPKIFGKNYRAISITCITCKILEQLSKRSF